MNYKILFFVICTIFYNSVNSQLAHIGEGSLEASAVFQINSSSQGLLIPRMSKVQIEAIPDPAQGLQVYCTNDGCTHIYDGSTWIYDCGILVASHNIVPSGQYYSNLLIENGGRAEWANAIQIMHIGDVSPSTDGGSTSITTSLESHQIIKVNISVDEARNGSKIPPRYTYNAGYEYDYRIESNGDITIVNKSGNSWRMTNKPLRIELFYRKIIRDD